MEDDEIRRSAKFLVARRGAEDAKGWAAQRALEMSDGEDRATWLRILQAIIDLEPSEDAETPLN